MMQRLVKPKTVVKKSLPKATGIQHRKAVVKPAAQIASDDRVKFAGRYIEAVGRRKNAVARVRLFSGAGAFQINSKLVNQYFCIPELQETAVAPLKDLKLENKFQIIAKVSGGGMRGQAEAVRHGVARALVKFDQEVRKRLKKAGFLKRDPRMKERRKYGLKKARRAPQWQKR